MLLSVCETLLCFGTIEKVVRPLDAATLSVHFATETPTTDRKHARGSRKEGIPVLRRFRMLLCIRGGICVFPFEKVASAARFSGVRALDRSHQD